MKQDIIDSILWITWNDSTWVYYVNTQKTQNVKNLDNTIQYIRRTSMISIEEYF